jgi:hypothetical protein
VTLRSDLHDLPPTISVERAAELLGIARGTAYQQARLYLSSGGADGIPALRLGERRILIPTARLLAMLGIGSAAASDMAP